MRGGPRAAPAQFSQTAQNHLRLRQGLGEGACSVRRNAFSVSRWRFIVALAGAILERLWCQLRALMRKQALLLIGGLFGIRHQVV